MSKVYKVSLFSVLVFLFFLSESCHADMPPDRLIVALEVVESHGDTYAIRDVPNEPIQYGCLQITKICLKDYNRIYKTNYKIEKILGNREFSIKICKGYIDYWATEKRIGRKPTYENMSRIWNGGPNGYKKSSTKKYWEKVKRTLNKQFKVSFNKKIGVNLPSVFFIAQNLYFWYHFAIASVVQW